MAKPCVNTSNVVNTFGVNHRARFCSSLMNFVFLCICETLVVRI